jgi:hypothetical protein
MGKDVASLKFVSENVLNACRRCTNDAISSGFDSLKARAPSTGVLS